MKKSVDVKRMFVICYDGGLPSHTRDTFNSLAEAVKFMNSPDVMNARFTTAVIYRLEPVQILSRIVKYETQMAKKDL